MSSTWKGAIEFGDYPMHVSLHNRVKDRGSDSFKTLAPNGLPISSVYEDSDGKKVARSDTKKGVKNGDGFTALTAEAVATIQSIGKSTVLEPEALVFMDSLDLSISLKSYKVTHDEKVAGSAKPVNQLWNILLGAKLAYCTTITMKSGGRDAILVIYPREDGLYAASMPFAAELNQVPEGQFTADPAIQKKGKALAEAKHADLIDEFDHESFHSEYRERRDDAIDKVLRGEEVVVPEAVIPDAPDTGDLLAALEGAVEDAGAKAGKPKAKKPRAKKSPKSKVAA
jgi:non-homologous end joining protein Ku